jgi:hypothetical protein
LGCDFDETDKTCYEYCVKHACFGVPHYPWDTDSTIILNNTIFDYYYSVNIFPVHV